MRTDIVRLFNQSPPHFSNSPFYGGVRNINDYIFLGKKELENVSVNLGFVKGQLQYSNTLSWKDKLLSGQKALKNLKLLELKPDYYISEGKKSPLWSFHQIGKELYVESGVQRTVLARFFAHFNPELFQRRCRITGDSNIAKVYGVTVTDWQLDTKTIEKKRHIDELLTSPKLSHLSLINTASPFCTPSFELKNNRVPNEVVMKFEKQELDNLVEILSNVSIFDRYLGTELKRYICA